MSERTVIPSPDTLIAHAGFIRAVARKLLLDDHEVDDVVQQTLLAALEKPPQRPGPLKPWLATVARNLARMRRRTEGRIDRREQAAARPESMPATSEIAARLETQRKLVEVVTALDEPYRDVVVLRFFDELPPREVAARLGIPVETVRTRTRRALEQLRGQLDRETDGGRKAWQLALLPLALPPARAQAAVATTATVGVLGVLGVKSIAAIAAVLLAAVFFLWHEASGDSDSVAPRAAETKRGDGSAATNALTPGVATDDNAEDGGGARGTREAADFVYRAAVVDEEGEPVRGAHVDLGKRGSRKTDGNGEIRVDGKSGENYLEIKVTKKGFVPLEHSLGAWRDGTEQLVLRRGATLRVRVLSPRGVPVVGAKCTANIEDITAMRGSTRFIGYQDERKAISDADGVVDFGRVQPADLKIEVNHPDFAWRNQQWEKEELGRGELEIRLSLGGTVRGVVRGLDGQPIVGATVAALVKKAQTGPDGRYEIQHVVTDGVDIVASHPNHGPAGFGPALGWDSEVPVRVPEGGEVDGIDILLGPATRVRGRFIDHQGKPVAGLKVNSYIIGGGGAANAAASGEDGRFELGPYKLKKATATWHIFYTKNTSHAVPENLKWTLRRGETTDVGDITVETRPIVKGRVLDAAGRPVAPRLRTTIEWPGGLEWVGEDGSFEIQLNPGKHRVYATSNGNGAPYRSEAQVIEMKANETHELELRLRPTVLVTGQVFEADGRPKIYEAVVLVSAEEGRTWLRASAYRTGTDREGRFRFYVTEPGEYVVGLPKGFGPKTEEFRSDVPPRKLTIASEPVEGLEFKLPPRQKKGVRVFGRVVEAKSGKAVKSYSLRLIRYKFFMPDHTTHISVNDGDGRFEDWVEKPGTYAVKVIEAGFSAVTTKTFKISEKGEIDLGTVKLPPALELTGFVRDSNGVPVPYAHIHLLGGRGDLGSQTFTGADGKFVMVDADVGVYNVFAVSPRHPVAIVKSVSIQHGRKNNLEIEVPDTSPLTIRVKDENGRPVAGATLIWTFPEVAPFTSKEFGGYEPPSFGENESDAEGVIRKPYTPSAPITVRIVKPGFATDSRIIRTKKGEPIEVEVVLKRK